MSWLPFIKKLGSGSWGTVFQSRMHYKGKMIDVAVKKFLNDDDIFTANARSEFNTLSTLESHQNIIGLLDFQSDKDCIYLVTEYGDRGDLEQFLKEGIPTLENKVDIMYDCASAIKFLHSCKPSLIHRDIKPQNVIIKSVDSGIIAKMCDFGLSKVFDPHGEKRFMSTDTGI